jgi:hypothetical protein
MGLINLLESPLENLQDEAKRRKKILICLFSAWLLIMSGLFMGASLLKNHQQKRLTELQLQMNLIAPKLTQLENQNQKQCVASRLKALFSSPIKGLYLSSISVNESWSITGVADYSQVLDQYKSLIQSNIDDEKWEENYSEGILYFKVTGKVTC